MSIGDMHKAIEEKDAKRYRWLRDRTGNKIMRKLMTESSPSRWDALVDADIAASAAPPSPRAAEGGSTDGGDCDARNK